MNASFRQVPEGTGWILDGFPANYNQAKLLEKALTGYEESPGKTGAGGKSKPRKSNLAPNPRPGVAGEAPKSGLDAVILLDLEDIHCLNRAIGRTGEIAFLFSKILENFLLLLWKVNE